MERAVYSMAIVMRDGNIDAQLFLLNATTIIEQNMHSFAFNFKDKTNVLQCI